MTDYDGRTAIHEAVIQNNIAVLDEFLKYEMARRAIDRVGRRKRTALHWAAALGERDEILHKLIDGGANLKLSEERGQTALRIATDKNDNDSKWIILVALIAKGDDKTVIEELISEKEIIPNETDREGETLLHQAVKKGDQSVTRTLVQTGAFDLNAMDRVGSTPLAYACQSGDEAMVRLLLDAGAVPGMKAESGTTPRSWAIRNGHRAIAGVLLEMENHHNADQLPLTADKDETDVKIAPCSKSEDGHGWPGWLADTAGQDNSRRKWRKTNLPKSFEMASAS
ncbi:hypothetical protein NHJ13734_006074 [Beauveria thailandica]